MSNKMYTITYEVIGGQRTDWTSIFAGSIAEAVKIFTETVQELRGLTFNYSEHAIISITCK